MIIIIIQEYEKPSFLSGFVPFNSAIFSFNSLISSSNALFCFFNSLISSSGLFLLSLLESLGGLLSADASGFNNITKRPLGYCFRYEALFSLKAMHSCVRLSITWFTYTGTKEKV